MKRKFEYLVVSGQRFICRKCKRSRKILPIDTDVAILYMKAFKAEHRFCKDQGGEKKVPVMYAKGSDKVGSVRVTSKTIPLFEGEDVIKVPDDGIKRVAMTRKELDENFRGKCITDNACDYALNKIFGEEAVV